MSRAAARSTDASSPATTERLRASLTLDDLPGTRSMDRSLLRALRALWRPGIGHGRRGQEPPLLPAQELGMRAAQPHQGTGHSTSSSPTYSSSRKGLGRRLQDIDVGPSNSASSGIHDGPCGSSHAPRLWLVRVGLCWPLCFDLDTGRKPLGGSDVQAAYDVLGAAAGHSLARPPTALDRAEPVGIDRQLGHGLRGPPDAACVPDQAQIFGP
jgi:hypothetical protein